MKISCFRRVVLRGAAAAQRAALVGCLCSRTPGTSHLHGPPSLSAGTNHIDCQAGLNISKWDVEALDT